MQVKYTRLWCIKNQSKIMKRNTRKITVNTQDLFDHSKPYKLIYGMCKVHWFGTHHEYKSGSFRQRIKLRSVIHCTITKG